MSSFSQTLLSVIYFFFLSDFLLIQLCECEIYGLKPPGDETSIPRLFCALLQTLSGWTLQNPSTIQGLKLFAVTKVFEFPPHFQRKRVSLCHKRMDLNWNSLALIYINEIECESIEIFPAVISLQSLGKCPN